MIRSLLVVMFLLCTLPRVASAGPACDADRAAMAKVAQDAALKPATEREAVQHVNEGNRHHREGLKLFRVVAAQPEAAAEFARAIDEYIAAARVSTAPSILYNIAQTYRAAGDYDKAIRQYRLFIDRGKPGEALRGVVECLIATMTAEQERAAASMPPRDAAPEPTTAIEPPTHPPPAPPLALHLDAPPARPWHHDGLGWGITGTGAALSTLGAFFLYDAHHLRANADVEPRDDVRADLRDQADRRATWGTVATITGSVVLAVGVIKLIHHPAPRATTATHAWLLVSPRGVALEGRF